MSLFFLKAPLILRSMKTSLPHYWEVFRSSFWFIPSVMAAAAAMLAILGVRLDMALQDTQVEGWWVYRGGAEGARAVLSVVAGSMISVAGTVFSITIVALTLASSQFGPRLLRNFMRDTVNQFVLGVFTSTFLFCLIVLRTVRGIDDDQFVPHLSITLGVLLAVASLGVLIYFIHHTSVSIQVTHLIRQVSRELRGTIARLYPEEAVREDSPRGLEQADRTRSDAAIGAMIPAQGSGYVLAIDLDHLKWVARETDSTVWLGLRPGQFALEGSLLANVLPGEHLTDDLVASINRAFVWGTDRIPNEDVECAVSQLVEIALRALSPGINDPFTAINCIDWLGDSIDFLASRATPPSIHRDEEQRVRVVTRPVAFEGVVDAAFNQIRQAARTNAAVTIRMLEVIRLLLERKLCDDRRGTLLRHAEMIWRGSQDSLPEDSDRQDVNERYNAVRKRYAASEAD